MTHSNALFANIRLQLVRRILRQTFVKCKEKSWDIEWIKDISLLLEKLLTDPKTCLGLSMHITEVFLEELSKVYIYIKNHCVQVYFSVLGPNLCSTKV